MRCTLVALITLAIVPCAMAAQNKFAAPPSCKPTARELQSIQVKGEELSDAIKALENSKVDCALLADVEIYHKAAVWIVRYADEEFYSKRYSADTLTALEHGVARARELSSGHPSWPDQKGQLVRAYRSRVDGSVQPYGVSIPVSYDGARPVRLDVVLHGRGATLNEVNFIAAHDSGKPLPPEQDFIRLDVYGRGNNAYRWAGETDVLEAIASVQQRYKIDPKRIVLRGFSMGGAGAWHIGLHYPDKWAAVEAGAGFTETMRYAKPGTLLPCEAAALHIYDAVDYALNAVNVPLVGYGGEDDGQLQASVNIREQLTREGFSFKPDGLNWLTTDLAALFLVGPKTGHKFHPDSKERSDRFIADALASGRPAANHIRFVTYTTRYNKCAWITVAELENHYGRAEVDARRSNDGMCMEIMTTNVHKLILADQSHCRKITVNGYEVNLVTNLNARLCDLVIARENAGWKASSGNGDVSSSLRKIHGLQGPIDDGFMDSFICVRPSGLPLQPLAHEYAVTAMNRLTGEFAKWMRGDVRIKDDFSIADDDIAGHNLVLFGDPGSNKLLEKIAGRLPVRWDRESIRLGGRTFSAADHVLVMIYPNPLNPARYVVINSGHTFSEKDFRGTNALLYPRLGDYAVLHIVRGPDGRIVTSVVLAGLFDDGWKLAE